MPFVDGYSAKLFCPTGRVMMCVYWSAINDDEVPMAVDCRFEGVCRHVGGEPEIEAQQRTIFMIYEDGSLIERAKALLGLAKDIEIEIIVETGGE